MNIAYAYKHGELVHIDSVVSGLKCGCECPKCSNRLIARKGRVREHHFAHAPDTQCAGSAETVLHLLTKEIVSGLNSIVIPPYEWKAERKLPDNQLVVHESRLAKGGRVSIDSVETEKRLSNIQPDIKIVSQGKELIIEIAVTHKVDRLKKRKLRKLNIPAIEIHLPASYALMKRSELRVIIENDLDAKSWLYHPEEVQAILTHKEKWKVEKDRFYKNREKELGRLRGSTFLSCRPREKHLKRNGGLGQYEYNRRIEAFNSKYGRYQTYEEAKEDPDLNEFRRQSTIQ